MYSTYKAAAKEKKLRVKINIKNICKFLSDIYFKNLLETYIQKMQK